MKKLLVIISVAVLGVLPSTIYANTTVEKNTAVNSCIGPNATCYSQVGGAAGDVIDFAFDLANAKPLGKSSKGVTGVIDTEQKDIPIALPQKPGDEVGYHVTFTKGESANEKIFIMIGNIVPEAGALDVGEQEIKIYRRFATGAANKWTEVGNFGPPKVDIGKIGNTTVLLKPDGTVIWKNSVNGKETIFLVAKKTLKEQKVKS